MSYLSRMNTRKYIKIFNKYVLPQSLTCRQVKATNHGSQLIEIGWERDS